MTIRGDSYGSVAEVLAFTKHLLDGETTFNTTTRPTLTEVEKFIDRASGYMNLALEAHGFSSPITNTTAALPIADWVVERSAEQVEMTQRGVGYNDPEGSRVSVFRRLYSDAMEFVEDNMLAFKHMGITQDYQMSDGLAFTGLDIQSDRLDPDDTSLEQPLFHRRKFSYDDPFGASEEEDD
jgi:hypothetical protein